MQYKIFFFIFFLVLGVQAQQSVNVDELIARLTSQSKQQKYLAISQLGDLGSKAHKAIPPLIEIIHGSDYLLKVAAAEALGKVGEKAVPSLVELFKADSKETREYAVDALKRIGSEVLPMILDLKADENSHVRVCVVQTLESVGTNNEVKTQLVSMLRDDDLAVKKATIRAIGRRKLTTALPELLRKLDDENHKIKLSIISALGQFGKEARQAISSLIALFDNVQMRDAIIISLKQIGDDVVVHLQQALSDKNPQIRAGAAEALGHFGEKAQGSIPQLIVALSDSQSLVRSAATVGLSKMGVDISQAVPALAKNLSDDEYTVRRHAAEALLMIGHNAEESIPALIEVIEKQRLDIELHAILTLKALGRKAQSAVPTLIKSFNEDHFYEKETVEALDTIEPQWRKKYQNDLPMISLEGISVEANCPTVATLGKRVEIKINVTNTGATRLSGVYVVVNGGDGVRIVSEDRKLSDSQKVFVGDLAEGQSARVRVKILGLDCGKRCVTIKALADRNVEDEITCCTSWKGRCGLTLECFDTIDPLVENEETTYVIQVINVGFIADYNVKIEVVFPEEMSPIAASGDTLCVIKDKRVIVDPYAVLQAKEKIEWKVSAKAVKSGKAHVEVHLFSKSLPKAIVEKESTMVY